MQLTFPNHTATDPEVYTHIEYNQPSCCLTETIKNCYRASADFIESNFSSQSLTFTALSLNSATQKNIAPEQCTKIQEILTKNKIPLNCVNTPKLIQKNHIIPQAIQEYLESKQTGKFKLTTEELALKERFLKSIDVISELDLVKGLSACCEKLGEEIKGKKYSLGFAKDKSQQWIAERALPLLKTLPSSFFITATDSPLNKSEQSEISNKERTFVIFDDASYSGQQAAEMIHGLQKKVSEKFSNQKCHLYLVIPFISSVAKKALEIGIKYSFYKANLDVHVITTDKKITAMQDVFSEKEMHELERIENGETGQGNVVYCNGRSYTKCTTILEWKIADHASIPRSAKTDFPPFVEGKRKGFYFLNKKDEKIGFHFLTDYPPPYKSKKD